MSRSTHGTYHDPADLVWLRCAHALGLSVKRSDDAFASSDGAGTLTICTPAAFDRDDSLAQMILHEICHAIVQGEDHAAEPDWGLVNTDDAASATAEHACHRLQAALLDRYGLRQLLAVTTDWRPYWDALPADPLAAGDDPAIRLAVEGWDRAHRGPWRVPLLTALEATAALADLVRPHAPAESLWAQTAGRNPLGVGLRGSESCNTCAWSVDGRCAASAEPGRAPPRIEGEWPACVRWEAPLGDDACGSCGACCREAFDAVEVAADDATWGEHGHLVVTRMGVSVLPRPEGRCVGLAPGGPPWRCLIYASRPQSCHDFTRGSTNCLDARRRVGRSRR